MNFVTATILCIAVSVLGKESENLKCFPPGTAESIDKDNMVSLEYDKCLCLSHVQGKNCDSCEPGFWNIQSGRGCISCNCNETGTRNISECNQYMGKCACKPGVIGYQCDKCDLNHYGFRTNRGCKPCNCHPQASESLQCDEKGDCPCKEHAEGRKCNRCKENAYDLKNGCKPCSKCYDLVRETSKNFLQHLSDFIQFVVEAPEIDLDADQNFQRIVLKLQEEIGMLWENIKNSTLILNINKQIEAIKQRLRNVDASVSKTSKDVKKTFKKLTKMQSNNNLLVSLNAAVKTCDKNYTTAVEEYKNAFGRKQNISEYEVELVNVRNETEMLLAQIKNASEYLTENLAKANVTCAAACESAKRFASITNTIKETKKNSTDAKKIAKDTKNRAQDVHQRTKTLLKQAKESENFLINDFDIDFDLNEHVTRSKVIINKCDKIDNEDLPILMAATEAAKPVLNKAINTSRKAYEQLENKKRNITLQMIKIGAYHEALKEAEENATKMIQDLFAELSKLDTIKNLTQEFADFVQNIYLKIDVLDKEQDIYKADLKNISAELDRYREQIQELDDLIKEKQKYIKPYEDYLDYLDGLPLTHEKLDKLENHIENEELYWSLVDEKLHLTESLKEIETIIDSLSIDKAGVNDPSMNQTKYCFRDLEFEEKVNTKT